jgi:protein TonB
LKYFLAFVIVVILHGLFYVSFNNNKIIFNKPVVTQEKKTSSIQYVSIKPKVIKKPLNKTIQNEKQKQLKKPVKAKVKKIITKKTVKSKAIITNNQKMHENNKIKNVPKKVKKPLENNNKIDDIINSYKTIKNTKQNKVKKQSIEPKNILDKTTKQFIDLYGKDFANFDKQTKLYLIENIKNIASATRRFLEYPYLSVQANQSGVSVVEFYLKPNGEIYDLKITKSSGYFLLDDNTIETIQAAYYDYPKPQKETLIKIFVKYELY